MPPGTFTCPRRVCDRPLLPDAMEGPPPIFLAGMGMWCTAQAFSALLRPLLPRPWFSFGTFMGKFNMENHEVRT